MANVTRKLTTGRNDRTRIIPGLTGLRGVAAVWVVLVHMTDGLNIPVVKDGYLGVDVFFILSGFVLTHVYANKLEPKDFIGYLSFLRARVARIYPLHVVMLCVVGLLALTLPHFVDSYPEPDRRFAVDAFVAALLLIQNWAYWLPGCWNGPSWSLSAEWFAYLTFPVFLGLTQRWRTAAMPLLLAAGSLIAFIVIMDLKGIRRPGVMGDPGMLRMAFEFACGCLLFRATANGLRPLPRVMDAAAVALLIVSLLSDRAIFLSLPAFALIVLLAAQSEGWISRGLSIAPIVFLGEISYSIYMVHWSVLQISNWMMSDVAPSPTKIVCWDVVMIIVILVFSMLTYRLVECPSRAWGRRVATETVRPLADAEAT